jgi:hypothetical protein
MKDRRALSVSAAARALKMHRASVHRYLKRAPTIRNARGKVVMWRLMDEIAAAKGKETRGRRLAMLGPSAKAKMAWLNKLSPSTKPRRLNRAMREYYAWRRELGDAWRDWSAEERREVAEQLKGFALMHALVLKMDKAATLASIKPAPKTSA